VNGEAIGNSLNAAPERLRALPGLVDSALDGADEATLRRRPAPTEWSAIEVAGHLVDKMEFWSTRVDRIFHEERPFLPAYDQDTYVRERGYQSADRPALLEELREACERFANLVEALPAHALPREGVHAEIGPITLERCIWEPITSAETHLGQIKAALDQSASL
jgi:hypothetical protein